MPVTAVMTALPPSTSSADTMRFVISAKQKNTCTSHDCFSGAGSQAWSSISDAPRALQCFSCRTTRHAVQAMQQPAIQTRVLPAQKLQRVYIRQRMLTAWASMHKQVLMCGRRFCSNAWKIQKDAHNVGQRPPASTDYLQHGVGSRRFALDLNGQNAEQQYLYCCSSSIPASHSSPHSFCFRGKDAP